jgi:hypothetical protein
MKLIQLGGNGWLELLIGDLANLEPDLKITKVEGFSYADIKVTVKFHDRKEAYTMLREVDVRINSRSLVVNGVRRSIATLIEDKLEGKHWSKMVKIFNEFKRLYLLREEETA